MSEHYKAGVFPLENQLNIYQCITVYALWNPEWLWNQIPDTSENKVWVEFQTDKQVPLPHLPLHKVIPTLPPQNKPEISFGRG